MSDRETPAQRGARRARQLTVRIGEELRVARTGAALGSRRVGKLVGISHTQVLRIERGLAPHVDLHVLARMAAVTGHELSLAIHPTGTPVRDAGHLALLQRLRSRVSPALRWRTEAPMPIPGDHRSADAVLIGPRLTMMIEAETRVDDVQALIRRIEAKRRDLAAGNVILLVTDSRHNREVIRTVPLLVASFPIGTRACLRALARGEDPGGDCLVVL